jgi:hypothetical protein
LINVSKVLNDLTHNLPDKYEEPHQQKLKAYIVATYPVVLQEANKLTVSLHLSIEIVLCNTISLYLDLLAKNPSEIAKTKSSQPAEHIPQEERELAEKNLRFFLDTILKRRTSSRLLDTSMMRTNSGIFESDALAMRKIKEIQDIINSPEWKKVKFAKGIQAYIWKDKVFCHVLLINNSCRQQRSSKPNTKRQ